MISKWKHFDRSIGSKDTVEYNAKKHTTLLI